MSFGRRDRPVLWALSSWPCAFGRQRVTGEAGDT